MSSDNDSPRSDCKSLLPVTTTIAQLKSGDEEESKSIKSCTVERSITANPVVFRSLQQNTNISQPPANWLKTSNQWERIVKRFSQPHVHSPSGAISEDFAQSFHLANDAVDVLPYVDVVANAENLKNLLKVPYDNQQILSLAIHRVGQTFLIDQFDAYAYLLDAQKSDWHWIRKWFSDNDSKRMALLLAASSHRHRAKTREKIRERDMLSKFLYYSIDENEYNLESTNPPAYTPANQVVTSTPDYTIIAPKNDNVAPTLPKSTHLKTAMWTLEDIKILVGSDLPIFSTGSHPCFSLRLCDSNRPINVMTGLDYWLDNLMCNVPEVVMCYHIDGIVQQYEVFKTEDLPKLAENSRHECQFSPHVVKDFATNILSFLRSNATKEGHTYWLLKEPDLDVVKLYDLTSLCEDFMDSVNDNPFSLPLAVLLCRLAYSILEGGESSADQLESVPHLLESCLKLVDRSKYPWLYSVVNYLHFTAASKCPLLPGAPSHAFTENLSSSTALQSTTTALKEFDLTLEKRSLLNLEYIANGLTFLLTENALTTASSRSGPVQWTLEQQHSMTVKLLRGAVNCYLHIAAVSFDTLMARQTNGANNYDRQDSDACLCIHILRNHILLARNCLAALRSKVGDFECDKALCSTLLQLVGDLHFLNVAEHQNCGKNAGCSNNDPKNLSLINQTIKSACEKILKNDVTMFEKGSLEPLATLFGLNANSPSDWPEWESSIDRIESAIHIYQHAFDGTDDAAAVVRRMANACVELANAVITKSLEIFEHGKADESLEILWKKAYFAFDQAGSLFESVVPVDRNNLAIVESNRARLMRVCAYCQSKSAIYYLTEASRRYALALKHLSMLPVTSQQQQILISRINWDLSSVYMTLADEEISLGAEENDRTALKYLSDAFASANTANLMETRLRTAEIWFREGKVRKRMLLRLLETNSDIKLCTSYLKLAEKSFEKCLNEFRTLEKWSEWTETHSEIANMLLAPKLVANGASFNRKHLATNVTTEIMSIATLLCEIKSASPSSIGILCDILSKLISAFSVRYSSPNHQKEAKQLCKKLDEMVAACEKDGGNSNDFSQTINKICHFIEKEKTSQQ